MQQHIGVLTGIFAALIGSVNAIAGQAGSANAQEPQATYQTKGIVLADWDIADWAGASYWEQKVGAALELIVDPRLQTNADERDAVLAAVWKLKSEPVAAETKLATITRKPTGKMPSKDIAYQITFVPQAGAKKKPRVEARFISEGFGARPVATSGPAAGMVPRLPVRYSFAGFPQNIVRYWTQHPGELQSILSWIGSSANPLFDQILGTSVVEGGVHRSTYFHVAGKKITSGPIQRLSIVFLGDVAPVTLEFPEQYIARDFGDLQIEKAQAGTDAQQRGKLGAITGIAELPAEERVPAKYAIWQYFMRGTRNAEVDAIVPVPNTPTRSLLTLRFMAGNNVSVQRIGESRKGSAPSRLGELHHVNGFGANSPDVPTLTAWLKKRYPAVTPTGASVTELENIVTAEIQKRSTTPTWFKETYGIDIIAAASARSQIPRSFQFDNEQLEGLRDFTPSELQMLEVALEKMSVRLVARLKGLQIVRQKTAIAMIGVAAKKFAVSDPSEAGVAVVRGNDRLIVMFDSVSLNSDALFVGGVGFSGKPEVTNQTLWAFAHELGHVMAQMPSVKAAFDEFVKAKNIKPVTWYSAFNPKDEFIAEAFALYVCDPEWLKGNRPDLFGWFETL